MYTLAPALIGHLVGDFILQNDWMAENKKKKSLPCLIHCVIYSLTVMVFAGWWFIEAFLILFISHYALDRTTIVLDIMKWKGSKKFATGMLSPWSIVAVDNTIHIFFIWLIWRVFII